MNSIKTRNPNLGSTGQGFGFSYVVEMAGVEPASERLDSRISTSVASGSISFALRLLAKLPANYSLEPEGSLRGSPRNAARHPDFYDILAGFGQENDSGGRGHKKGDHAISDQLMQLKEELRNLCDWHLLFCTDFTRSVPLGSQSGTSFSRRDLASPCAIDYSKTKTSSQVRRGFLRY